MRSIHKCAAIAIAAAMALTTVAACGSGSSNTGTNGPVTLTWWHNGTTNPILGLWKDAADAYHKAHPDVSFNINPIQNEQIQTKIPLALQGNNPPDIFQQWGGGDEATQLNSGKLADLSQLVSSWIGSLGRNADGWKVGGKQYGVPYDLHVVGFWYRKDVFQQAGITSPPATMTDLTADIAKLKAAGIAPISIGSKDKWPDAFWWDYFAIRDCPTSVLQQSMSQQKLSDPCFVKAGQDLTSFLAINPFQTGYLGTPAQQGAGSSAGMLASGKAAMELQGDWELSTIEGLTNDQSVPSKLGWFPFPSIPGGAGDQGAVLGGGDGFSCTSRAAAQCAGFLQYIDSTPEQQKWVAAGGGLPANPAAASSITNPAMKDADQFYQHASYVQMYFDKALPTAPGQALDDAVANFFGGKGTIQSIPQSVSSSAAGGNR